MVGTGNLNVGWHGVQFYGHDEDLARHVADYLTGALRQGGVAIVIATAEHRRAFETRMTQAGVDVPAAAARRAYLALDADEALREFMLADRPDRDDFDRVIGRVIGDACGRDRPVRAYGEMVSVLWDAGLVNAAVQVEELWNDLARKYTFSLFCGYPAAIARDGPNVDAFAEVCRLHQEIIRTSGEPGVLRTFAYGAEAPANARHFAVGAVRRWGDDDLADDVALVVTELAANAIGHARSGFTLALSAQPDVLRISVRDTGPLPKDALRPAPLHGLGAVDALAIRWGVEWLGPAGPAGPAGSSGKEVWVELRR